MNHDNSDNDRLADPFDQHHDDDPTGYASATFGRVGTGKTQQLSTELVRRIMDTDTVEFADPKGEGEENGG
jgi:ATP-dependent phosphoenolpyruvate carboxykinase